MVIRHRRGQSTDSTMPPSDLPLYFLQVPNLQVLWISYLDLFLVIVVTMCKGTPNSSGNWTPFCSSQDCDSDFSTVDYSWVSNFSRPTPTCSFKSSISQTMPGLSRLNCSLDHSYSQLNRQLDLNFKRELDAIPRLCLQAVQLGRSAGHLRQCCSFKSSHLFQPHKSH